MSLASEDSELDMLEVVSIITEKPVWEVFLRICEAKGFKSQRTNAYWVAWIQEDFLPDWMVTTLRFQLLKTMDAMI